MECGVATVKRKIGSGGLEATQIINKNGRPQYQIAISSLPLDAQHRWYMQQGEKAEATAALETASAASKAGKRPPGRKELDAYTVEQRGQIAFWMDTVAEWREFRRGSGKAEETDRDFVERLKARHPGLQISKATLYRKWQAVRTGDWDSLVENRGKARKGQTCLLYTSRCV